MKMGRTCPVRPPFDSSAALPDEAGPSALGSRGAPNEGLAALICGRSSSFTRRSRDSSSSSSTSRCSTSKPKQCGSGVEALMRWRHPGAGLIPPRGVHPVAEETRDDRPDRALGAEQGLRAGGGVAPRRGPLGISVNVSARQLDTRRLPRRRRETRSRRSGLDPADADARDHRDQADQDADGAADACASSEGARGAHRDRRLRHRLRLARLPARFPVDAIKIDRCRSSPASAAVDGVGRSDPQPRPARQDARARDARRGDRGTRRSCGTSSASSATSGQGFLFARPLDVKGIETFFERHATREQLALTASSATSRFRSRS